jgi:DNA polymerase III subunit epsilon
MRWTENTWIAFDLETTGKYPLDAEICEMAAVKWRGGQVLDTFQTLIKPTFRMSQEVINIHHISNEMVENAPTLTDMLPAFSSFIQDGHLIAHHAPFDMGFLAWDFERLRLPLPVRPVVCTSLLSRALNGKVKNHKLATLAQYFHVEAGAAHRALDDAKTCLQVALHYFAGLGAEASVSDILRTQGAALEWPRFSIESLMEREALRALVQALRERREVALTYNSGSRPGQSRKVQPLGLVRSLDGDFLVASEIGADALIEDERNTHPKRYFLDKISAVRAIK